MRDNLVLDLADCTEFRQTLQAKPDHVAAMSDLAPSGGDAGLWTDAAPGR